MRHPTDLEERGEIRILFIAGNPTFRPVVTRFLERCGELSLVGTVWGREKVLAQALDLRPQVILLDMDKSTCFSGHGRTHIRDALNSLLIFLQ